MNYGRKMAGDALNALGDLDARYANAIKDRFKLTEKGGSGMIKGMQGYTSAVPIRDIINNPYQPDRSGMSLTERIIDAGSDAAVLTSNLAARYGLPAGGVTLAGIGLYETGQALMGNQQTGGTVVPM